MNLSKPEYNQLPESLREELAQTLRDHWGMFYDNEYWKDMEVIEDVVFKSVLFRWLAGSKNAEIL